MMGGFLDWFLSLLNSAGNWLMEQLSRLDPFRSSLDSIDWAALGEGVAWVDYWLDLSFALEIFGYLLEAVAAFLLVRALLKWVGVI